MRILAVFAHADDETFGCGGSLAKHAAAGDRIHLLWFVSSRSSRNNGDLSDQSHACGSIGLGQVRAAVADRLRATWIAFSFADQGLDALPQLTLNKVIEAEIEKIQPDLIYTHTDADANVDHVAVSRSVSAAAPGIRTRMCEIPNTRRPPGLFNPNRYEDVTDFIDEKLQLSAFYRSELRAYPHPRSIGGLMVLARYRGLARGFRFAEAFEEI